ncbi:MAG: hypothetical protein QM777_04335 [Pseudorhodoferax sp.]
MNQLDADDAQLHARRRDGHRRRACCEGTGEFNTIDQVWLDKARGMKCVGGRPGRRPRPCSTCSTYLNSNRWTRSARQPGLQGRGPGERLLAHQSRKPIVFERKVLGFVPALWNAALTGGFDGDVKTFDRYTLEITPGAQHESRDRWRRSLAALPGAPAQAGAPDWQVEVDRAEPRRRHLRLRRGAGRHRAAATARCGRASYDAMYAAMHYNDRQTIVQREEPIEIKLNVKGGAITRLVLLHILQREGHAAGVHVHYGERIETRTTWTRSASAMPTWWWAPTASTRSCAGSSRRIRHHAALLTNHFAWYGTNRVFDHPALVFRKFDGGHFVAHYYAYSERDEHLRRRMRRRHLEAAGPGRADGRRTPALFEKIYAPELQGIRSSPTSRTGGSSPSSAMRTWTDGRHVLIGDALARRISPSARARASQ